MNGFWVKLQLRFGDKVRQAQLTRIYMDGYCLP